MNPGLWISLAFGLLPAIAVGVCFLVRQRKQQQRLEAALAQLRQTVYSAEQAERLLHTLIDAAPMAILLLEDIGDIEYANEAARQLFFEGRELGHTNFLSLLDEAPLPLREAVLDVADRFFTVEQAGSQETYHLAKRHFELHQKTHTLLMVKHLTREIRRQEVDVWKKLIRVLSHELNNSLAPISSLVHSAQTLTKPETGSKLERVFSTIAERVIHLQQFIEGYSRFAKLPPPHRTHVNLGEFLSHLEALVPDAKVASPPAGTAYIDRLQLEQVVINLLKNAREAGGDPTQIELGVQLEKNGTLTLTVSDRGPGMSEQVLENAMLPFYSTKERGSGLGLALCREIVEAHNGQIRLENREGGGLLVTVQLPGFERRELGAEGKLTLSRL
jgi:nitrogen fixation/metabolism regulation signal transduction histidine kinase